MNLGNGRKCRITAVLASLTVTALLALPCRGDTAVETIYPYSLEQAKLVPSDGYSNDYFGLSVAISGDCAIVGAYYDDDNGSKSGSAYIFQRSGSDWIEQAKLTPADGYTDDRFGVSVAISGDYAIVGALYDYDNGSSSGSAYIFQRSGTDWIEQAKLVPADGYSNDRFGRSVAISGDYAIVGACYDDDNGSESGSAYIFQRSGSDWTEQAKLTPADGYSSDYFGLSVAISGDYAIVGAYYDDDNGSNSGSAYIFQRSGTDWIELSKLTPSDGYSKDRFGVSVAISGDYAIVGAYYDDDNGSDSGSAYIFQRSGTDWIEMAKLKPSDGYSYDNFGYSVAIIGEYAIVGANLDSDNGSDSGSAYIFQRSGTDWTEQNKIKPADGYIEDRFGYSVAISDEYAIVGAFRDDDNGDNSGSAYIFGKSYALTVVAATPPENFEATGYEQGPFTPGYKEYILTNISPDDIDWTVTVNEPWLDVTPSSGTLTGGEVVTVEISLNANANTLRVGVYSDTIQFTNEISYLTQTREVMLTATLEQTKLLPSDGDSGNEFGDAVAISGDYAIVGANSDDNYGSEYGSVYIFQRSGNDWIELTKLTSSNGYSYDYFGFSVAISGDYAIVGAYGDDDNSINSGAAYIFQHIGNNWIEQEKLVPSDGDTEDRFGRSVAISGDYAIVGAFYDDDNGSRSGSAYIFQLIGSNWIEQAKLIPADGYAEDHFGCSVTISGDYAIVGAVLDDDNGTDSGSAYIFQRSGSDWIEQEKLTPADGYNEDRFGISVASSGDYAVVGAIYDDDNGDNSGSVYIFQRSGSEWTEQAKLTAADGYGGDLFGRSVAISGDYVIVGAYRDDDNGIESGSAYIFKRTGTEWTEQVKLTPDDGYTYDYFGVSVAISGKVSIVGAYLDDDNGTNSGSAYIFGKADALAVRAATPPENFEAAAFEQGTFIPGYKEYILTNISLNAIDWTVTVTEPWLDVAPGSGILTGGAAETVDISINTNANTLPAGHYVDNVNFYNLNTGFHQLRTVDLFIGTGGRMYWVDRDTYKIQRANLDGTNVQTLVTTGLGGPQGIALDISAGKMYWTDYRIDKIQRANLDGSCIENLVTTGLKAPQGIALNPLTGKMYWTDYSTSMIQRANLDGTNIEDLVTMGLTFPYGIALDPLGGKMYWTDAGSDKIQRANLDGSNIEDLVSTGLSSPIGITLDLSAGRMYWTDSWADRIQSANLDGSSVKDLVTGLSGPYGIALDSPMGKMYWTDYSASRIQRANMDGSNVQNLVITGLTDPAGIAIPLFVSLDDLYVTPSEGLSAFGVAGETFDPNSITYTLTNNGPNSLDWTVTITEPWLDAAPRSGTLTSGAAATVDISINPDANTLPVGFYSDTVEFTNQISTLTQTREVTLTAQLEKAKLVPSDGYSGDRFGFSVAISGDYAIAGAYYDADNGSSSGSAYIFQRSGTDWIELTKLTPADGYIGDRFGVSVAISGDYAIVGAHNDDDNGRDSGSAYIFQRSGTDEWIEQDKLLPSDGYNYDHFGFSVAISGDYAIVGAYHDYDDNNGTNSGSAYIFQRSGSSWTELAKLVPSDGYFNDYFGYSVDISGDYTIVGASRDDDSGSDSGSAYIFQRSGTEWIELSKLKPADGYTDDRFGVSVAISGDYTIVGASRDDDSGSDSGSAYIFQRSDSEWTEQTKLTPADGYSYDNFGYSVAIRGDYAIVGAHYDDDNGSSSGSAYIFQRSGSYWIEKAKLTPSDGSSSDNFGYSVAISDDYAIVGAHGDDDNGSDSGSAYIFDKAYTPPSPIEVQMKFTPQALNLSSGGRLVKAHFTLPEYFAIEDVDANTPAVIEPYGIKSYNLSVLLNDEGLVRVEATFIRSDLCASITTYDQSIEVKVTGSLTTGQQFYGTDIIKITDRAFEYLGLFVSHWLEGDCIEPDWCGGADLNADSVVNFLDFALLDRCCIEVTEE